VKNPQKTVDNGDNFGYAIATIKSDSKSPILQVPAIARPRLFKVVGYETMRKSHYHDERHDKAQESKCYKILSVL
jgi:hypothetical protein